MLNSKLFSMWTLAVVLKRLVKAKSALKRKLVPKVDRMITNAGMIEYVTGEMESGRPKPGIHMQLIAYYLMAKCDQIEVVQDFVLAKRSYNDTLRDDKFANDAQASMLLGLTSALREDFGLDV